MHHTPPMSVDPAAAQAWLGQPAATHPGLTRAECLGIDDELTGPRMEGFLSTVEDVLVAEPDGLRYRDDIIHVELWLIPDGDILAQGALITVDLANLVRLATLHQDIRDFADRDQRGMAAILSALRHIACQVCLLLDTYQTANPHVLTGRPPVLPPLTAVPPIATAAARHKGDPTVRAGDGSLPGPAQGAA
jgi:hypothetical protein